MRFKIVGLHKCILLVIITLFFYGCATNTKTRTWKSEGYSGDPFSSILVIGLAKNQDNRTLWENVVADELQQNDVEKVVMSSDVFPSAKQLNKMDIINYVNENSIEGVLVTRLVDLQKEVIIFPPSGAFYLTPYDYYNSFDSYYDQFLNEPHYRHTPYSEEAVQAYEEATKVQLVTTLYKSDTKQIVWSMASITFDPRSVRQVSKEVGKEIAIKLKGDLLL